MTLLITLSLSVSRKLITVKIITVFEILTKSANTKTITYTKTHWNETRWVLENSVWHTIFFLLNYLKNINWRFCFSFWTHYIISFSRESRHKLLGLTRYHFTRCARWVKHVYVYVLSTRIRLCCSKLLYQWYSCILPTKA